METIEIIVQGDVQGVFFRQSTLEKAMRLDLNGTVCNCKDGSVLIVATGTKENLNSLITWCHHGPARAHVTKVDIQHKDLKQFSSFTIERK